MQVSSILCIVVPLLFLYEAFIQYSSLCNITLGGVLKSGHKHILTANIIATRKQCSDQVLFVTFPSTAVAGEEKEEHTKQDDSHSQGDILQRIANQGSSYVLPVDCLKGSMLKHMFASLINSTTMETRILPRLSLIIALILPMKSWYCCQDPPLFLHSGRRYYQACRLH
jgi:hypothetical protein